MSEELTIERLMNRMPKAFIPEKAEGVDVVLQFHFTGDDPSEWFVTIKDLKCEVERGVYEESTLAITVDAEDWLDVFTGDSNAMALFAAGKIKLKGDLNLAMKMMNYFKM
jgi:putative sterol carrier protein